MNSSHGEEVIVNLQNFYSINKNLKNEKEFVSFRFTNDFFGLSVFSADKPANDYRGLQTFDPESTGTGVPAGQLARLCTIPHRGTPSPKRRSEPGTWRTEEELLSQKLRMVPGWAPQQDRWKKVFITTISRLTVEYLTIPAL